MPTEFHNRKAAVQYINIVRENKGKPKIQGSESFHASINNHLKRLYDRIADREYHARLDGDSMHI